MKTCAEIQDAITDVLLFTPADEIKVSPEDLKSHLGECADCRAESVQIAKRVATVNAALCPPVEKALGPDFFDRLMARLEAEGGAR